MHGSLWGFEAQRRAFLPRVWLLLKGRQASQLRGLLEFRGSYVAVAGRDNARFWLVLNSSPIEFSVGFYMYLIIPAERV